MAKVEDLLAKALSTSSEDEAIACLKMARKRGGTFPVDDHSTKGPSMDSIREVNEHIKIVRSENIHLREYIRLIEGRYEALAKQNAEISASYHASRGTSIALMFFAVGVVFIAAMF